MATYWSGKVSSLSPGGKEMQWVAHNLEPIFDADSRVLILGTMPSPISRREAFYYANPANRFWRVMEAVLGETCPSDPLGKRDWLLRRHIALWDVLCSCSIDGASDQSIRNPVPNDIPHLLGSSGSCRFLRLGGGRMTCIGACCKAKVFAFHLPARRIVRYQCLSWWSIIAPSCLI